MDRIAAPTKDLHLKLPEELAGLLSESEERVPAEALEAIAVDLFRRKLLTLSTGSRALGLGRADVIRLLGKHRVPFVDYDEEEIEREAAGVKAYFHKAE